MLPESSARIRPTRFTVVVKAFAVAGFSSYRNVADFAFNYQGRLTNRGTGASAKLGISKEPLN
jgi:hypothetical protein